jgi:hypothetical protein
MLWAMKRLSGNGEGKFRIAQHDMGGWVRVHLEQGEPPDDLPFYLSHALTGWFRHHPHMGMRLVVPVVKDGETVELHAWYDQSQFPDTSPLARKPGA